VWLAASTHAGEEEIALEAHARIRAARPDALMIVAPRHPARGAGVSALGQNTLGQGAPRRALGAPIGDAPVYVADTMGELGLFYRLAPVSFVGGSLRPELSGHNPIEPAKLGSAILVGPHVESFADLYEALDQAGGVRWMRGAEDISAATLALWANRETHARQVDAAGRATERGEPALEATLDALVARLGSADAAPKRAHAAA
jgi:3-deoxy-D-manno-octulosonic-acid transferase